MQLHLQRGGHMPPLLQLRHLAQRPISLVCLNVLSFRPHRKLILPLLSLRAATRGADRQVMSAQHGGYHATAPSLPPIPRAGQCAEAIKHLESHRRPHAVCNSRSSVLRPSRQCLRQTTHRIAPGKCSSQHHAWRVRGPICDVIAATHHPHGAISARCHEPSVHGGERYRPARTRPAGAMHGRCALRAVRGCFRGPVPRAMHSTQPLPRVRARCSRRRQQGRMLSQRSRPIGTSWPFSACGLWEVPQAH